MQQRVRASARGAAAVGERKKEKDMNTNDNENGGFVFRTEWQEPLADFPAAVRLEVYEATIAYASGRPVPPLRPLARMAFGFIRQDIDEERPGERRQDRQERLGGAADVHDETLAEMTECWNKAMAEHAARMPRVNTLTEQEREQLAARVAEYGEQRVAEAMRRAAQSDFLNGGGRNGFTADLLWVMRPQNFAKVLAGRYGGKIINSNNNDNNNGNSNGNCGDREQVQQRANGYAEIMRDFISGEQ